MILKSICAVAACKLTRQALRLFHRGGTALPGKAARLFDPDILKRVSEGMEIIVVTGTNGKTTTCSMLENALRAGGRECLSNKSGANLLSGVTAELTCNATWSGKPKTHYAVIECDEGALKQVAPLISPKVIIVTNLFRDQLDRYGEVMHTLDEIRKGILASPGSILCLNADDSLTGSLAGDVPNPVVWYGLDTSTGEEKEPVLSDARYCIRCGTEYGYHYHTYAHLGGFFCPKCGYSRPEPDFAVTQIEEMNTAGTRCRVRLNKALHGSFTDERYSSAWLQPAGFFTRIICRDVFPRVKFSILPKLLCTVFRDDAHSSAGRPKAVQAQRAAMALYRL